MRGSMFLAVLLIVVGLMLMIAAYRGRASELLDALAGSAEATAGTVGSRALPAGEQKPSQTTGMIGHRTAPPASTGGTVGSRRLT